jgi:hypothetical protein
LAQLVEGVEPNVARLTRRRRPSNSARAARRSANMSGRRKTPPRHHKEEDLLRFARRLFLRAVHRCSWSAIADQEEEAVETRTVRATVPWWAEILGVALPKVPGGRPRKSAQNWTPDCAVRQEPH